MMPVQSAQESQAAPADTVDLFSICKIALDRWRLVVSSAILGAALAAAYAWSVNPLYAAEVVLVPRETSPSSGVLSQFGQLGGLAGLVGIGPSSKGRDEAVAILRSRAFLRAFIMRQGISSILKDTTRPLIQIGDRRWTDEDAVDYFASTVRSVYDDKKTGQVRITVEWPDAKVAAHWANLMVSQLNEAMREQALQESDQNIAYLTSELERSKVVALTDSIASLLENEFKRKMMARGASDYAFKVIDPAVPPVNRVWPKRLLLTAIGGVIGMIVAVLAVLGFRFAASNELVGRPTGKF